MKPYNYIELQGTVGKEMKVSAKVSKFSLCVWQGKEKPFLWIPVVFFGELPMYDKGTKVQVNGRLAYQEYNGKKIWQVYADSVYPVNQQKTSKQDDDFLEE